MVSMFPEWLVSEVASVLSSSGVGVDDMAAAVLDALAFMPDYAAFKRAGRDRMLVDTWTGTAIHPEVRVRRREALDELSRLSEEIYRGDDREEKDPEGHTRRVRDL